MSSPFRELLTWRFNCFNGKFPCHSVGRKLALLEMRVVIINLFNRFAFTMADDPDFQEEPGGFNL